MEYVVERYVPGLSESELRVALAELEAVAAQLRREGLEVRYLGSTFFPHDEACFSSFESASSEAVVEVNACSTLPFARILEAVRFPCRAVRENVIRHAG